MFNRFKKLMRAAQEITTSTDLEELFRVADIIERSVEIGDSPITPKDYQTFASFLSGCMISHPIHGLLPFKPYPFQSDVANTIDQNRVTLIQSARQLGLSTILACYAAYSALLEDNQTVVMIGSQYQHVCDQLRRAFVAIDGHAGIEHVTRDMVRFSNGSVILARAGNIRTTLAGIRPDVLIIDQANSISHAYIPEIMRIFANNRMMKLVVQDCGGQSLNDLLPTLYRDDLLPAGRVHLPWSVHPERDQKWEEDTRSIMGARSFRQEHEAETTSDVIWTK